MFTSAAGVELKPGAHTEIGVAFEFTLAERREVFDNRLTVDWFFSEFQKPESLIGLHNKLTDGLSA